MEGIIVETFQERKIAIKGIGKLFYQEGFPISMSVIELNKKGIEISILHVANECLKNGWSAKTILSKFREDFADSQEKYNVEQLEKFVYASYEDQREMIFQYLFGFSSKEAIENPEKRQILKKLKVYEHD